MVSDELTRWYYVSQITLPFIAFAGVLIALGSGYLVWAQYLVSQPVQL